MMMKNTWRALDVNQYRENVSTKNLQEIELMGEYKSIVYRLIIITVCLMKNLQTHWSNLKTFWKLIREPLTLRKLKYLLLLNLAKLHNWLKSRIEQWMNKKGNRVWDSSKIGPVFPCLRFSQQRHFSEIFNGKERETRG